MDRRVKEAFEQCSMPQNIRCLKNSLNASTSNSIAENTLEEFISPVREGTKPWLSIPKGNMYTWRRLEGGLKLLKLLA
ncbi:unnamed protein product [Dovyalis caffra]|uniref:Uncharacterized protein n=1 Tax=Dovyalis caffra TaxID=77055 RepID=A0AAV1S0H0_9ROSI|nr:unnamed protein product [Dovyalis caffra]